MANTSRLPQIDALRGCAALYVVCFHAMQLVDTLGFSFPATKAIFENDLFHQGQLAVRLFFCTSGFIVFRSLQRRRRNDDHPFRNFFIRRAFRILPLWWAISLLRFFQGGVSPRVLAANVFMLFGFLPYPDYLPHLPSWSLFVEELFYLALPLFVLGFSDLRRASWIGAIVFTGIAWFWTQAATRSGLAEPFPYDTYSPLANFQFFFIGIGLSFVFDSAFFRNGVDRKIVCAFDFSILGILAAISLGIALPHEFEVGLIFASSLLPWSFLSKCLSNRFLMFAGKRCYFIYLAHLFLYMSWPYARVARLFGLATYPFELQVLVTLPAVIAITLLMSELSWRFFESPLISIGDRLIQSGARATR